MRRMYRRLAVRHAEQGISLPRHPRHAEPEMHPQHAEREISLPRHLRLAEQETNK